MRVVELSEGAQAVRKQAVVNVMDGGFVQIRCGGD